MKVIKNLQGHRWFIWTIVFVVVSLVGLVTYIVYVSNQDANNVSSYSNNHKADPVITKNGISYLIDKTPDGTYVQLVAGAPENVIKKVNETLSSVFNTSCFGNPKDPQSLSDLRGIYNDSVEYQGEEGKIYASEEEVANMGYKELRQRLIDDFGFESSMGSEVTFASKDFLSISASEEDFCGGAHPNFGNFGFNFNLHTGEDIQFVDLFKNYKKDKKTIEKIIKDYLNQDDNSNQCDYENLPYPDSIENMSYAISEKGIIPLSLGFSHAEAYCESQDVTIPFYNLSDYLKSDNLFFTYKANIKGASMLGSWYWQDPKYVQIDYNGDGKITYESADFGFDISADASGKLSGHWFGTYSDAKKVNGCFADDAPCLSGNIIGNKATVDFSQTYGGASGKATIEYNPKDDTVSWKITQKPEGEYYIPNEVILKRDVNKNSSNPCAGIPDGRCRE